MNGTLNAPKGGGWIFSSYLDMYSNPTITRSYWPHVIHTFLYPIFILDLDTDEDHIPRQPLHLNQQVIFEHWLVMLCSGKIS